MEYRQLNVSLFLGQRRKDRQCRSADSNSRDFCLVCSQPASKFTAPERRYGVNYVVVC